MTPFRPDVAIVGGGPVGLTAALDCAQRGLRVALFDDKAGLSEGSRAICWSKRTLAIFDRLGVAGPMLAEGVVWQHGKVFHRDRLVCEFDLLPEAGHKLPAFINLQQYRVEEHLLAAAGRHPDIALFRPARVTAVEPGPDGVVLGFETADGLRRLAADWLIAADGARSFVRRALGLGFEGRVFEDRFLIADVRMQATFPTERWFWFDPPFHPGGSALLHRQAGDLWRIDLQLGPEADPDEERRPERVTPRLQAMLGPEVRFELDWVSVYTFQCRRLEAFRHGRVLFAGDAAHQVSPFGARGGNSGIEDVDNLAWKLALVAKGQAPERLLDSYDEERRLAADENILITSRSTDFISPKGPGARALREAVLTLAERHERFRRFVNSGRLSTPICLAACALQTPGGAGLGLPAPDAPVLAEGRPGWLLDRLGAGFNLLIFADGPQDLPPTPTLQRLPATLVLAPAAFASGDPALLVDCDGLARRRYGADAGTAVLIRPDQHIAARWPRLDEMAVGAAHACALGRGGPR